MSIDYISANVAVTSGDALDLGLFTKFYLAANVSVSTTDGNGDGIAGNAAPIVGNVYGSIFAGDRAFYSPTAANSISVGATGTVTGLYGLFFDGGYDTINNQGVISSEVYAIYCGYTGSTGYNTIVNSGTVESSGYSAIFLYGGLNSITNSGVISGNGGIIISNATTDGADEIVNSGAIYGNHTYGVLTGNASTKLTNTGQITGGVSFGVSYDTLINKGTITGNVKFGAGGVNANPTTGDYENYYDGTGGSVSGTIIGGAGKDHFIGGSGADRFDLSAGGVDWAFGGDGNDRFAMGANLFAADMIDGGKGFDTVVLNGDYSAGLIFAPKTMTNVEQLLLKPGHSYNLTPNDATVAAGQTLIVDGSTLGPSDAITLNATRETNGYYDIRGGAAADTFRFTAANFSASDLIDGGGTGSVDALAFTTAGTIAASSFANVSGIERITLANGTNSVAIPDALVTSASGSLLTVIGGGGQDTLDASGVTTATNHVRLVGGAGADQLIAGGGADTFAFNSVIESTGPNYDTVKGADFAHDHFDVPGPAGTITAINPAVTTGSLSTATFNTDLAAAIGAAHLGAHDAMLFTPSAGTLAGQRFLLADLNGTAGYQTNADLVVHLVGQTGTLATTNFV